MSRGVRAGKAFVELGVRDRLGRGLLTAGRKLRQFGSVVTSIGKSFAKAGIAAGVLSAGLASIVSVKAIKAASEMEETMGKFTTVFGESSDAVKEWSDELASRLGRSKQQMAEFISGAQDLFVPLGFADEEALKLSKTVTQLAVDLASFNNKLDVDTMRDLQAAMTGSGEVMKKYGVIVSEAAVKQEILNTGFDPKVATEQQKVMARLNIILRGTTAAQGDAERTAGSFANQMKALQGNIDGLAVAIGNELLPIATKLVATFSEFIKESGPDFAKIIGRIVKATSTWITENHALQSSFRLLRDTIESGDIEFAFSVMIKKMKLSLLEFANEWKKGMTMRLTGWGKVLEAADRAFPKNALDFRIKRLKEEVSLNEKSLRIRAKIRMEMEKQNKEAKESKEISEDLFKQFEITGSRDVIGGMLSQMEERERARRERREAADRRREMRSNEIEEPRRRGAPGERGSVSAFNPFAAVRFGDVLKGRAKQIVILRDIRDGIKELNKNVPEVLGEEVKARQDFIRSFLGGMNPDQFIREPLGEDVKARKDFIRDFFGADRQFDPASAAHRRFLDAFSIGRTDDDLRFRQDAVQALDERAARMKEVTDILESIDEKMRRNNKELKDLNDKAENTGQVFAP